MTSRVPGDRLVLLHSLGIRLPKPDVNAIELWPLPSR